MIKRQSLPEFALSPLIPISTCDLCDAHKGDTSGAFRVLPPVFMALGGLD